VDHILENAARDHSSNLEQYKVACAARSVRVHFPNWHSRRPESLKCTEMLKIVNGPLLGGRGDRNSLKMRLRTTLRIRQGSQYLMNWSE